MKETTPAAPGLKWRSRAGGRRVPYWVARADIVKRGYPLSTVPLHVPDDHPNPAAFLADRCRLLQAEMLEWASGRPAERAIFNGTLGSLIDVYRADQEGPYSKLQQNTRQFYDYGLDLLKAHAGARRLDKVAGRDIRQWHAHLRKPAALTEKQITAGIAENPERPRRAYAAMQMLRVVIGYGVTERLNMCRAIRDVLEEMEFESPARRESQMTYAQVRAFRAKAIELGRPSMALAVTLQFDLSMRQGDVIGKWSRDEGAGEPRWHGGLTWSHIKDGVLVKRTNKTATKVEHDLARLPDTQAEIARVPAERRVGPIVLCEGTGLPYRRRFYAAEFRRIARLAGIPDDVWSMDARAGAVTEALDAGADDSDVMNTAGHTQVSTTHRYNRSSLKKTGRVADLRIASRKNTA